MTMAPDGASIEMQMDFTDFGTDVDIAAPDPDDTRAFDSITEMQQELSAMAAGAR
jgi:hypothetical protein